MTLFVTIRLYTGWAKKNGYSRHNSISVRFSLINIISVLAANQSLDVTCLALVDRTQKSISTRFSFSWSLSEILALCV